ncbi:MAG TPA: aldolase [Gaiellales bacterium]|nr:aldolase [Gaiellales bacterium]
MTTTPAIDPVTQAKVDLAAALRAAALYGLNEGVDNHFSLALPGSDDRFLLNRFGPHWSEITASDLITVDLDGEVVEGDGDWEVTAFMIHRGVHLARPSARCVLHTHMPYATAVSMIEGGLDTRASQNSMMFHGRVVSLEYGGHADASDEGNRIGDAVGDDTWVVMLENHGVLAIGETVAEAWHRLYFLERACQVQVLAQSTGRPLIQVSEELAARTAGQAAADANNPPTLFAAVRRQLDRESPGYQF